MIGAIAWSPELIGQLRTLWDKGLSAGEIARKLTESVGIKITRNAVLGKAHRIGCDARSSPIDRSQIKPRPPKKKAGTEPTLRGLDGCAYPMWRDDERPTHVYCGGKRTARVIGNEVVRSPYCETHHQRCRIRVTGPKAAVA